MTTALERRVGRLEDQFAADPNDPFGIKSEIHDERQIRLLDLERALLAHPEASAEMRAEAAAEIEAIEREIIRRAASYASGEYVEHWKWQRESWDRWHSGEGEHMPPLFGDFDCDWEKPNLMQRRAALRSRPDIAALIAQGEAIGKKKAIIE